MYVCSPCYSNAVSVEWIADILGLNTLVCGWGMFVSIEVKSPYRKDWKKRDMLLPYECLP